jgi:hypothetical protein
MVRLQARCCAFSTAAALLLATSSSPVHYAAALSSKVTGDPANMWRHLLEGLQVRPPAHTTAAVLQLVPLPQLGA